jgi:hypothetical protein
MAGNLNRQLKGSKHKIEKRPLAGQVVDNNDPMKCQRCRIRVRDMYGNLPDSALPWVGKRDAEFTGAAEGVGSVSVPPIGSKVWVEYEDDTPYHGRYYGAPATTDVGVGNVLPNYPNVRGFCDEAGNKVFITTAEGSVTINIIHVSGTNVVFSNNGDLSGSVAGSATLNIKENLNAYVGGSIELDAQQNINLKAGQSINIEAPNVTLTSSGGNLSLGNSTNLFGAGSLNLTSGGNVGIGSGGNLSLAGSSITKNQDINDGGGVGIGSSTNPSSPQAPITITPGERPVIKFTPNNFNF